MRREIIPLFHMFPRQHEVTCSSLKKGVEEAKLSSHVKSPVILKFDPMKMTGMANSFKREIETLEILSKHPHPNIVKYYGCIMKDGYICGICLERCTEDLYERVSIRKSTDVDVKNVIE